MKTYLGKIKKNGFGDLVWKEVQATSKEDAVKQLNEIAATYQRVWKLGRSLNPKDTKPTLKAVYVKLQ